MHAFAAYGSISVSLDKNKNHATHQRRHRTLAVRADAPFAYWSSGCTAAIPPHIRCWQCLSSRNVAAEEASTCRTACIRMKSSPADLPQFGQDELDVLLRELRGVIDLGVPGDVVELGCYRGDTSVRLARLLGRQAPDKKLYVYDSFEGLPAKSPLDESPAGMQFMAGELHATKREVIRRLRASGFTEVKVVKAWFSELSSADLPVQISFAFLDGDFYRSILDSLQLVWPLLAPGATVIVDDYRSEALPGAARAVDEWLAHHPVKFRVERSLAIIRL